MTVPITVDGALRQTVDASERVVGRNGGGVAGRPAATGGEALIGSSSLINLYENYRDDLATALDSVESTARNHQAAGRRMRVQFDDLESELLYLAVRHARPKNVVEISPCDGWSTLWILHALRDNGTGHLSSFDLHDRSRGFIPPQLAEGRWDLHVGDVRSGDGMPPAPIDVLLIDSAHTAKFARWYLKVVLPQLQPDGHLVIHDVERPSRFLPASEGRVLKKRLKRAGCRTVSFSRWSADGNAVSAATRAIRSELGLPDHKVAGRLNPAIYLPAHLGVAALCGLEADARPER